MANRVLTRGTQATLRDFLTSAEGRELMGVISEYEPQIGTGIGDSPIESAALTGMQLAGWKKFGKTLWQLSDPTFEPNKIVQH